MGSRQCQNLGTLGAPIVYHVLGQHGLSLPPIRSGRTRGGDRRESASEESGRRHELHVIPEHLWRDKRDESACCLSQQRSPCQDRCLSRDVRCLTVQMSADRWAEVPTSAESDGRVVPSLDVAKISWCA